MVDTSLVVIEFKGNRGEYNKLYCQQGKENSLVVILPDGGYSCDRPLLYYARKAALGAGHDVLCLSYGLGLSWRDTGQYSIELQAEESMNAIKKCLTKEYRDIYFVSKSIGTEVAACISGKIGFRVVKNIFLTPTSDIIKKVENSKCFIVVGTKDDFFTQEHIDKIREYENFELLLIKGAGHSLEVEGRIDESLRVMNLVVDLYVKLFTNTAEGNNI